MDYLKVIKNYSKRDKTISLILIGLMAISLVIVGLNAFAPKKTTSPQSYYTEGLVGELPTLNPLFREYSRVNRELSTLVYSGLTKYNPEKNAFDPDLADFEVSGDGTVFTFTLKDNVEWHDGTPLTANDILFTYKTVIQNANFENAVLKSNFEDVSIELSAENQVTFTLPQANAYFLSHTDTPILPKHILGEIPVEEMLQAITAENSIGTGPYSLKALQTNADNTKQIDLKLNDKYYGNVPSIKNIRYLVFNNEEELLLNQEALNSIPNLKYENLNSIDTERFDTESFVLPEYTAIFVNTDVAPLTQSIARKALSWGANKRDLLISLPSKEIISGPFFQFEEIGELMTANYPAIIDNIESDGWEINDAGVYEKNFYTMDYFLTIQNFPNNPLKNQENERIVQHLIDSYKKIGVKITPRYLEPAAFSRALQNKDYELVLAGHSLGNNLDTYSFWHSSQTGTGGTNLSNYQNVVVDNLLENLRQTSNPQSQRELIQELNLQIKEDVPAIFLYTEKHLFAFDNKIKKRKILKSYAHSSDRFYNLAQWELKK
jgi:peptide/nickel transport system substrate-binding protein